MITKEKKDLLHELLWHSGYRQIKIHKALFSEDYECLEVHCNAITIDVHTDAIKDLLAGMGYSVDSNSNKETITIK